MAQCGGCVRESAQERARERRQQGKGVLSAGCSKSVWAESFRRCDLQAHKSFDCNWTDPDLLDRTEEVSCVPTNTSPLSSGVTTQTDYQHGQQGEKPGIRPKQSQGRCNRRTPYSEARIPLSCQSPR